MKFDHVVSYNGKYYPAGEDVPIEMEQTTLPVVEEVAEAESDEEVEKPVRRRRRTRGE